MRNNNIIKQTANCNYAKNSPWDQREVKQIAVVHQAVVQHGRRVPSKRPILHVFEPLLAAPKRRHRRSPSVSRTPATAVELLLFFKQACLAQQQSRQSTNLDFEPNRCKNPQAVVFCSFPEATMILDVSHSVVRARDNTRRCGSCAVFLELAARKHKLELSNEQKSKKTCNPKIWKPMVDRRSGQIALVFGGDLGETFVPSQHDESCMENGRPCSGVFPVYVHGVLRFARGWFHPVNGDGG